MNTLTTKLKSFRLSGMANSIEERAAYANNNSLSYKQFLELLCEDETNARKDNSYKKRYASAKFPSHKLIEDFDFNFQPSIDKKQINDLMTCAFIQEKKNIVFIGNPGTGKTHIATALGINAIAKDYHVLFISVSEMLYRLHISKADNTYYKKLGDYLKPDLLILDELGFKKIPSHSAGDFFEVISKRYERSSSIITTNKDFEQWGEILGDNVLSSAILDRLMHYSTVINARGLSYRSRNTRAAHQQTNAKQKETEEETKTPAETE